MVNGKKQNTEYILQSEDICAIRIYPAGTVTNPDHPLPNGGGVPAIVGAISKGIEFLFGKPIPDPITTALDRKSVV